MSAIILSGKEPSQAIRSEAAERAAAFEGRAGRRPKLGVLRVGRDPESGSYLKVKARAAAATGIGFEVRALPQDASQQDADRAVESLSDDPDVDGVLVELPLPERLSAPEVLRRLDPAKDVEGLTEAAMGRLYGARTLEEARGVFWPCTAEAIMLLVDRSGVDPEGLDAAVIGRSNVVGKPASQLLQLRGATTALCHIGTHDVQSYVDRAEFVVCATTTPRWLKTVKPGAVVLDAGTHFPGGGLCGDADPAVAETAGWLTPVPGGIGPVTTAVLLRHVVEAAERR